MNASKLQVAKYFYFKPLYRVGVYPHKVCPQSSKNNAARIFICISKITGVDKWKTGLCPPVVHCIIFHSVNGPLRKPMASLHPAERCITLIDGSLLLHYPVPHSVYSVHPGEHDSICKHFLFHVGGVWHINLCMCLTRKWICTEPTFKTSLAWQSVTGLMMRMRLGSTLVRYVMQGSSQSTWTTSTWSKKRLCSLKLWNVRSLTQKCETERIISDSFIHLDLFMILLSISL